MTMTYRLVKYLPDESDDAVTIQSIRALEGFVDSRGSEHMRDVLETIAAALRNNQTVSVVIEKAMTTVERDERVAELARVLDPDVWMAREEDQKTVGAQWDFTRRRTESEQTAERIIKSGHALVKLPETVSSATEVTQDKD